MADYDPGPRPCCTWKGFSCFASVILRSPLRGKVNLSPVWWGMSVNPAHGETRQEDYYFKAMWALSPDSISKEPNQNKTKS